jgi:phospholipid N-methyltransferase
MQALDFLRFFRAVIFDSHRLGAVMPSSEALGKAITEAITEASSPIIELGPGTGVFTRALLARGVPEHQLTLIENSKDFTKLLESRFPSARVVSMDACGLENYSLFEGELAGAVVSGLPLLAIPKDKVTSILNGAFAHMRPDGVFYQFTYGVRCPVSKKILDELGLEAIRTRGVLINVPPASVYCIRRKSADGSKQPHPKGHRHSFRDKITRKKKKAA